MTEKYIFIERVTGIEERFINDYSEGTYDKEKFTPKTVSTGWWVTFDNNFSIRLGEKPADEEDNLTIKPGDRMKFTMEKAS